MEQMKDETKGVQDEQEQPEKGTEAAVEQGKDKQESEKDQAANESPKGLGKYTLEEMKAAEFSPEEIAMAEKRGLVKKDGQDKKPDNDKAKAAADKAKGDLTPEKAAEIKEEAGKEKTDEEEKAKLKKYNDNELGLYWSVKKERIKRQAAEKKVKELDTRIKDLETELEVIKEKKENLGNDDDELLTTKHLKDREQTGIELQEKEREITKTKEERIKEVRGVIEASIARQEIEAQVKYTDYKEVTNLAQEVLKTMDKSSKVRRLYRSMIEAAADPEGSTDETAADIAYQIGTLHPDYKPGKMSANKSGKDGVKTSEKKGDVDVDRILKNVTRKGSSSSVTGGEEQVPESELKAADYLRMSKEERRKLSPETRDRILRET